MSDERELETESTVEEKTNKTEEEKRDPAGKPAEETDAELSEEPAKDTDEDLTDEPAKEGKKLRKDKKNRKLPVWKIVVVLSLLFVFTFFLAGVIWALASWSVITTDELLWHLKMSLKGANTDMVVEFCLITIGSAVLITGVACFAILFIRSRASRKAGWRIYRVVQVLTALILVGTLITAWFGFNIGGFIKNYINASKFIDEEYVDPGTVQITFPEKKRNLIYIYLESMEVTYMDEQSGGAFPENVIPELTTLAKENEDFSGTDSRVNGGIALPGAVWTMGAIFGTTAGLPLKTPLGQNGMSANNDFFPGLITLSDILEDQGYQNRLIMGSDATFGGCRLYFESHGDFTIHDYVHAKEIGRIPEDYKVWWGYEDEKLFDYAREELTEMAAEDKPFQLVLQTMDTHFEDGHSCRLCRNTFGDDKYANVMNCSSRMVDRFVEWVKEQDFYENTTIIITGDHPTMDKNFCENVPESYQRKTYTCIINGAQSIPEGTERRNFSTFDLFPTALASLGVTIEGERLGLGTNLYSTRETLLEQYGLVKVQAEMEPRSNLMVKMYRGSYTSPGLKKDE
ncbi:MAG: sulfatase-like hydrolase/transferase [Eubacterium sp.]|nr:sulfatase-like hydrolase/transferase [Eubacterium sp.]